MLPPQTRLDPEGLYARLGVGVSAAPEEITAAYRRKARLLHPDVPVTGDSAAFVAVKQAYDVLVSPERRAVYDRSARKALLEEVEPGVIPAMRQPAMRPPATRQPRLSDLPVAVWVGLAALLCVSVVEVVLHLSALTHAPQRAEIRPNAPIVAPATPAETRAAAFGPAPVRLAGVTNYYVVPAAGPTILWRHDDEHNVYKPAGQVPPFSAVQALRLNRQTGLVEVRVTETTNAFIEATRLAPGNLAAARRAYCGYNTGPIPADGEVLARKGAGKGRLTVENRSMQPAVVKLRDAAGGVVASVFLGPGGHADLTDLPNVDYRPDFAIGELWSRACNGFAAGMRAQRLGAMVSLEALSPFSIPPDAMALEDISDLAFERE